MDVAVGSLQPLPRVFPNTRLVRPTWPSGQRPQLNRPAYACFRFCAVLGYFVGHASLVFLCIRACLLILCTAIGASIGAKNLIPEEMDYTKIGIRVTVMNKV